jgi:MtN3 and saliva related transmembrane protein
VDRVPPTVLVEAGSKPQCDLIYHVVSVLCSRVTNRSRVKTEKSIEKKMTGTKQKGLSVNIIELIGIVAGILTTISFLPQVIKTWRYRSAKDLSLTMFICFCLGVFLWLIYGIYVNSKPIIIANFVTFILAGTILYFKITYD